MTFTDPQLFAIGFILIVVAGVMAWVGMQPKDSDGW